MTLKARESWRLGSSTVELGACNLVSNALPHARSMPNLPRSLAALKPTHMGLMAVLGIRRCRQAYQAYPSAILWLAAPGPVTLWDSKRRHLRLHNDVSCSDAADGLDLGCKGYNLAMAS